MDTHLMTVNSFFAQQPYLSAQKIYKWPPCLQFIAAFENFPHVVLIFILHALIVPLAKNASFWRILDPQCQVIVQHDILTLLRALLLLTFYQFY